MGRRGPPKTPTPVLKARGSKLVKHRPDAAIQAETPACPAWLSVDARKVWQQVVPQLESRGVLTLIEQGVLARFCDLTARYRATAEYLNEHGPSVFDKDGNTQERPEMGRLLKLNEALGRLDAKLGTTPADRGAAMPVTHGKSKKASLFAAG